MSWKVITAPKQEGGLGLIDPLLQCKAFLGDFLITGLLTGGEPWEKNQGIEWLRLCLLQAAIGKIILDGGF